jgi:hypothetical protein
MNADETDDKPSKLKLISAISVRGKPIKFRDKPLKLIDIITLNPGLPKNDALRKHLQNVSKR